MKTMDFVSIVLKGLMPLQVRESVALVILAPSMMAQQLVIVLNVSPAPLLPIMVRSNAPFVRLAKILMQAQSNVSTALKLKMVRAQQVLTLEALLILDPARAALQDPLRVQVAVAAN